jgi:uncharacterized protein (DUF433 family)
MTWEGRIVVDADVLVGKPIVRGTRLAVEFIIELLAQGWTEADILKNYPGLTREDIQACLAYASDLLRAEKTYPVTVPLCEY